MRTIVLTGATSGIGLAAAHRLADPTIRLIAQGPESEADAETVLRPLRERAGELRYVSADFTDLAAVQALATAIEALAPVDVLINNAAIAGPRRYTESAQGVELTFHINYLAGSLLTDLLLPVMPQTARIVNTASATHYSAQLQLDDLEYAQHRYSSVDAYSRSKLAIVTASRSLARRISQTVVSIHPGVISTALLHAMFGSGGAGVDSGGANLVAAIDTDVPSGSYLDERSPAKPNPIADDPQFQQRLHEVTSNLLGLQLH